MGEAFEWDEVKAAANYAKHGVSFETATKAFQDAFAIERLDDRGDYGEDRYILTRTAEGVVLVVVYTERSVISGSSRRAAQPSMSKMTTSSKITDRPLRSMTPEEVEAAANNDPDNRPLSPADLVRMKRTPQVKSSGARWVSAKKSLQRDSTFRLARCAIGNRGAWHLTKPRAPT